VVEDDAGMRAAIHRLLQVEGFQSLLFDSAEALLASGAASQAQCLVLDVHLPGLSGFELYSHLAGSGAAPPAVFITAHDQPKLRRQALASGSGYLVKPFSGSALVDEVNHALVKVLPAGQPPAAIPRQ
jgi:FixJ family two-component response regulator